MAPCLPPVDKPKGLMLKLGYRYTKKQFGQVPSVAPAKLAALADFESSDHFSDRERAALGFVTEVARDRRAVAAAA